LYREIARNASESPRVAAEMLRNGGKSSGDLSSQK
jgi:hypothetical protein